MIFDDANYSVFYQPYVRLIPATMDEKIADQFSVVDIERAVHARMLYHDDKPPSLSNSRAAEAWTELAKGSAIVATIGLVTSIGVFIKADTTPITKSIHTMMTVFIIVGVVALITMVISIAQAVRQHKRSMRTALDEIDAGLEYARIDNLTRTEAMAWHQLDEKGQAMVIDPLRKLSHDRSLIIEHESDLTDDELANAQSAIDERSQKIVNEINTTLALTAQQNEERRMLEKKHRRVPAELNELIYPDTIATTEMFAPYPYQATTHD